MLKIVDFIDAFYQGPQFDVVFSIRNPGDDGKAIPVFGFDQSIGEAKGKHKTYRYFFWDIANDNDGCPSLEHLNQMAIDFGEFLASEHQTCLFHCTAGVSRSTSAALYLLLLDGYQLDDAVNFLKMVRPIAQPNLKVLRLLDEMFKFDGKLLNVQWNLGVEGVEVT